MRRAARGARVPVGDPARLSQAHAALGGVRQRQTVSRGTRIRLEGTGLFQSVSLVKSNREPFLSSEAVAFRIECSIKPDATESANPKQPKRAPLPAHTRG